MTLSSYWWLLIWIFAAGLISLIVSHKDQELVMGKPEVRWSPWMALVLVLPLVFWAANRRLDFRQLPAG